MQPQVPERDHLRGPAEVPVTLVEYGDYECPYCGAAYPIVKEVQRRLADRLLAEYAAEIGLDEEQFDRDMTSQAFADRVRADFMSGVRSGVNGTPTFFIKGQRHNGPYDVESLLAAIERAAAVSAEARR